MFRAHSSFMARQVLETTPEAFQMLCSLTIQTPNVSSSVQSANEKASYAYRKTKDGDLNHLWKIYVKIYFAIACSLMETLSYQNSDLVVMQIPRCTSVL